MINRYIIEECECNDCQRAEQACLKDCDLENECYGCHLAREAEKDAEFDVACAQGSI